jgi:MFS family permease
MAASTLGQLAMSATGVTGFVPFVVGAIAFICAVLPSALTSTPQPRPLASARLDVMLLYKTSPVAVIASFSCGMANGTFGTLAPVYGYTLGLDAAGIAYLFSITAIVGAIAQIPAGRFSDLVDRRIIMVALATIAALVGAILVVADPREAGAWLYAMFGIYGFAAYPIYAIAAAHANDFAGEGGFAKVAGGMLLILGIGLATGPLLASLLMNIFKPVGFFVITATFHAVIAVTAFLRMRIRPVRDVKGRVRFQIMDSGKPATPEAVVLDPRAEEIQENLPMEPRNVQVGPG